MGMGTEIPFPRQPCKDPCDPTRNLILLLTLFILLNRFVITGFIGKIMTVHLYFLNLRIAPKH